MPPWDDEPICECSGYIFRGHCAHQKEAKESRDRMSVKSVKSPKEGRDNLSIEDKLNLVTGNLSHYYNDWKESEELKDTYKDQFFDLITEYIEGHVPLTRSTEQILLKDGEDIETALKTRYPDQRISNDPNGDPLIEVNPDNDQEWIVVMEPDPSFMKFQWVNPENQMVYARGRSERGAGFDVTGFLSEFPEIAAKCVTMNVNMSLPYSANLEEMSTSALLSLANVSYSLDEDRAEELVVADPSLMSVFAKFRVAPKVSLSLAKPRVAKKSELS